MRNRFRHSYSMAKNETGFSIAELLVSLGIATFILVTWSTVLVNTNVIRGEVAAQTEALQMRAEIVKMMSSKTGCRSFLAGGGGSYGGGSGSGGGGNASGGSPGREPSPGQSYGVAVSPVVGSYVSVTLTKPGEASFFDVSQDLPTYGSNWQILSTRLITTGIGGSTTSVAQIVHANLELQRKRFGIANAPIVTDTFPVALKLDATGSNRILDCFRTTMDNVGSEKFENCPTSFKMVFSPLSAQAPPIWHCEPQLTTGSVGIASGP